MSFFTTHPSHTRSTNAHLHTRTQKVAYSTQQFSKKKNNCHENYQVYFFLNFLSDDDDFKCKFSCRQRCSSITCCQT